NSSVARKKLAVAGFFDSSKVSACQARIGGSNDLHAEELAASFSSPGHSPSNEGHARDSPGRPEREAARLARARAERQVATSCKAASGGLPEAFPIGRWFSARQSADQCEQEVQRQADHAADKGAVQANPVQVLADLLLDQLDQTLVGQAGQL